MYLPQVRFILKLLWAKIKAIKLPFLTLLFILYFKTVLASCFYNLDWPKNENISYRWYSWRLTRLHQLLEERAKVTPQDTLIFFRRLCWWIESPQVIDYLIDLSTTNSCFFLRGNHDELLYTGFKVAKTIYYGTTMEATVNAYKGKFRYKHVILNFSILDDYHFDEESDYLFMQDSLWMVLAMNFILNYFIGITLWETALSWPQY
jgi:hypothetical protein